MAKAGRRHWSRAIAASLRACLFVALAVGGNGLTGCTTLRQVLGFRDQAALARETARISGRIDTEGEAVGNLIVILGTRSPEDPEQLIGVDSYVRVRPGNYAFSVAPGRYQVGAYEDRNKNGLLDPGERTRDVRESRVLELAPGEAAIEDIRLSLDATTPPSVTQPINVLELVARTPAAQRQFSLWAWSVQGEICEDLDADAFGPEAGKRGLWRMVDFINDRHAGIYFMEPYDRSKIPVLFVHGISGYPQEFETLIEGIDRERFQPWFYFYPSGFRLDGISTHLETLLVRLQVQYDFDELAIVAHSMGGLVARGAILKYFDQTRRDDVRLFLSISTPWGGDPKAEGAEGAPVELPESFDDMSPNSDYLRWIFYADEEGEEPKPLPKGVEYHLVLGFKMSGSSSKANDGTVSVASQARLEAQRAAASVRAYDHGHVDILRSPEILAYVNAILNARLD